MPLLEVCLVGELPLMSYLGSMLKKPDAIVWLRAPYQKQMISHVEAVLASQISTMFESREIIPGEITDFVSRCEGIIRDYPNYDILVNVTGGSRLQALLAMQIFKAAGKEVMYIDQEHSQIVNPVTGDHKTFHFTLTVNEYIALHGLKMDSGTRFDPDIGKRSSLTYFMGNNCDQIVPFIDRIRQEFNEMGETKSDTQWRLENHTVRFSVQYEAASNKMGFRFGINDRTKTAEVDTNATAFLFDGGWLRELVFLRVHRSQYDDVRLNARLDRETMPDRIRAESMIDIAMMKGCNFYIFQCFSYPITRESFIELSSIQSTVKLLNARGYIFTAHRPHRAFIERSHEGGLEIISGRRITNFSI